VTLGLTLASNKHTICQATEYHHHFIRVYAIFEDISSAGWLAGKTFHTDHEQL